MRHKLTDTFLRRVSTPLSLSQGKTDFLSYRESYFLRGLLFLQTTAESFEKMGLLVLLSLFLPQPVEHFPLSAKVASLRKKNNWFR